MADEEQESALDVLLRTVTLALHPQGGRVFAHHATINNLDRQTIELKCEHRDPNLFFGKSVVIGDEVHPVPQLFDDEDDESDTKRPVEEETGWRLGTIPIMLSIFEVDADWLHDSSEKHGANVLVGQLSYHPRINTDDGAVNDKWPRCTAWVGVGPDTFRLLRDRVLNFQKYDFQIGMDVLFPSGGVENAWKGRTIKWDGNGQLPILSAVAVWTKEDWSSDYRRKERLGPPKEAEYVPSREHVELMRATERIEAGLRAVLSPLFIIAFLILVWLIVHR